MNKKETGGKTARREQRRAERRRSSLMWNTIVLGTLGVAALLVVMYLIANLRPGPLAGELVIPNEGQGEVPVGTELNFLQSPPSSGTHFDEPAPWGLAAEPVVEGYYLNNLARGGVVVLYTCADDCAAVEAQFQDLLKKAPKDTQYNTVKVLITRYTQPLPTPIVALAWGHQLNLPAYDEAVLLTWYRRFVNQGPANAP
ncbi:MAG: DUF3105 domain-containing protein [Anaerolineales bacterium]|nr:DUF3105 domain-containing protein [Anaerolineales bacterium]